MDPTMTGAHYPSPFEELHEPNVQIGIERITIGDVTLPTRFVEADSVVVESGDESTANRVTLTIFAGDISIEPEATKRVHVRPAP